LRLRAFDSLPDLLLKTRRERSGTAPFLEHLAKRLIVIARGFHLTSEQAAVEAARLQ